MGATITGGRELSRALDRLSKSVGGRVMRQAVKAGADVIQSEAKALVPVRTGTLRDHIDSHVSGNAKEASADVGIRMEEGGTFSQKDAFYARFVEFGTVKMPAQPYLRPAFDTKKDAAVNEIQNKLRAAITNAVGRG